MKIPILHQDQDIIVIDKPAGIAVHRAAHQEKETVTVASELLTLFPDIKNVGEDPDRPGIVHRLDKLTSGVMVIARTQSAFEKLKKQFKMRETIKLYLVLVEGTVDWQKKKVDLSIRRTGSGRFGARHLNDVAKLPTDEQDKYRQAQTEFKLIKSSGGYSLLSAAPKTGRTHQIRVHLKAIGLPVVGDPIYSSIESRQKAIREFGLKRQFLHAESLSFVHPGTAQPVSYKARLPRELLAVLSKLDIDVDINDGPGYSAAHYVSHKQTRNNRKNDLGFY